MELYVVGSESRDEIIAVVVSVAQVDLHVLVRKTSGFGGFLEVFGMKLALLVEVISRPLIHQDLDLPPLPAHFLDQLRRVSAFSFLQTTLQVAPLPVGSVLERLLTPSGLVGCVIGAKAEDDLYRSGYRR